MPSTTQNLGMYGPKEIVFPAFSSLVQQTLWSFINLCLFPPGRSLFEHLLWLSSESFPSRMNNSFHAALFFVLHVSDKLWFRTRGKRFWVQSLQNKHSCPLFCSQQTLPVWRTISSRKNFPKAASSVLESGMECFSLVSPAISGEDNSPWSSSWGTFIWHLYSHWSFLSRTFLQLNWQISDTSKMHQFSNWCQTLIGRPSYAGPICFPTRARAHWTAFFRKQYHSVRLQACVEINCFHSAAA